MSLEVLAKSRASIFLISSWISLWIKETLETAKGGYYFCSEISYQSIGNSIATKNNRYFDKKLRIHENLQTHRSSLPY